MPNQYFIYDSDDNHWNDKTRTFELKVNEQRAIRSAGLTEEVQIYQMVGECVQCRPQDVLWEPVQQCGAPLVIGPENNQVWLYLPGTYSIGDPNNNSLLVGDVNITAEKFKGVDPSLLGKCEQSPLETIITNDCDTPVLVEMCDPIGIETSMAELGCIADNGVITGKVMLCKTVNEDGTGEVVTQTAYFEDGTVVNNYTGPWQVCTPDVCVSEAFIGVITDLSILSN